MTDPNPQHDRTDPWPFRADLPQRYGGNYHIYRARGGLIRPEDDVQGFVAGGRNQGDMGRFYFFSLAFDQIVKEKISGDLAELGVYKGHTATLLAIMARRLGRTVYLLDTFEGFDASDLHGIDVGAKEEEFRDTSVEAVRALVREENVRFIQGYFPETASLIPHNARFCLVHIDCDLYAPILAALRYFYARLEPGGFLIMHDYSSLHWDGAEKAVDEFFSDKPESVVPLMDGAGSAVIRKSRVVDAEPNWLQAKRLSRATGEWLDAGNGRIAELLGPGWSKPEPWGIWGVGEVHELRFALPVDQSPIELDFDVHVVLLGSRVRQRIDVVANDQKLANWEFTPESNRGVRSLQLRVTADGAARVAQVTVEFRPEAVAAPRDLDSGVEEKRPLGLGLHRIRLNRRPGAQ